MITILHIWLATGAIVSGEIPAADCLPHILTAQAAVASGGYASLSEGNREVGVIVRMQCGEHDVVLALPVSNGDCEAGA